MEINEAIELTTRFVSEETKHIWYNRCCELARTYKALITGEDCGMLLRQFVRRETKEEFDQRVALTVSITPAVCNYLMKPFNKVLRNKKVKKDWAFDTDKRNEVVRTMTKSWYGNKRSNNIGLDYWLANRYPMLSFSDPNMWVVTEWDTPATKAEVIKPRPFEVTSEMAWHWKVKNGETIWLWVHMPIAVAVKTGDKLTYKDGNKFTLYDEDLTLVWEQVDKSTLSGIALDETTQKIVELENKDVYIVSEYRPNIGYCPAFRLGYEEDPYTNGETFVNGFHAAMPYLMKTIKTVSELDLTMCLHAFPQKMVYVEKCPGVDMAGCNGGKDITGKLCKACKGTGKNIHTSAQDMVYYTLEPNTPRNEVLELDKMIAYKSPPIDLVKFQNDYIQQLKRDCKEAVFSSTSTTMKVSGSGDGNAPATATEVGINMQGVYDALFPYTERISTLWVDLIYTFGKLADMPESYTPNIVCIYPSDPKMKSLEDLLVDLKAANEAGAPAYLVDQINRDIAALIYEGDEDEERKFEVKHSFYPFNGLSQDAISVLLGSQYTSNAVKVLYCNFEQIFTELEKENVGFYLLKYDKQYELVWEKVQAMTEEIEAASTLSLKIPTDAGNGEEDNNGGGNGGGDDEENPEEETPTPPTE